MNRIKSFRRPGPRAVLRVNIGYIERMLRPIDKYPGLIIDDVVRTDQDIAEGMVSLVVDHPDLPNRSGSAYLPDLDDILTGKNLCGECNLPFGPIRKGQKFCSILCSGRYHARMSQRRKRADEHRGD